MIVCPREEADSLERAPLRTRTSAVAPLLSPLALPP